MTQTNTYEVLATNTIDEEGVKETRIYSIKRLSDGEIFSVGDYVTNGTKMRGVIHKIDEPSSDLESDEPFVTTDWSNVGMNLESLIKLKRFNYGDAVSFKLPGKDPIDALVCKVHYFSGKTTYDLDLSGNYDDPKIGGKWNARIQNIDSVFVIERQPTLNLSGSATVGKILSVSGTAKLNPCDMSRYMDTTPVIGVKSGNLEIKLSINKDLLDVYYNDDFICHIPKYNLIKNLSTLICGIK